MKIKATLGIGYFNATREDIIEIPDEELEGLNEDEVTEVIDNHVFDWTLNQLDVEWQVVEENNSKNSMKVRELIKLLMEEDMDKEVRIYAPCNPNTLDIVGFVSANDKEEDAPVTLII